MPENDETLDTSSEVTTETPTTPAPDKGGDDFQQDTTQPGDTPPASSDWRVDKYGADWQNSIDYHRDTNKYLRGELDKAKRSRPQRRVEETTQPQPTPQQQQPPTKESLYGDVQTVDEFGNRIEQRFESKLAEMRQQERYVASIRAAREREQGDPKRGIPSFADIEQEVLIPFVERNPWAIQILRDAKDIDGNPIDSGAVAYTLGVAMKYKTWDKLLEVAAGRAREELGDRINEVSREAVRVGGRRDGATSARLTPADIEKMSSADFEKLVARNTGRTP